MRSNFFASELHHETLDYRTLVKRKLSAYHLFMLPSAATWESFGRSDQARKDGIAGVLTVNTEVIGGNSPPDY